jgi:hypothetical protein
VRDAQELESDRLIALHEPQRRTDLGDAQYLDPESRPTSGRMAIQARHGTEEIVQED